MRRRDRAVTTEQAIAILIKGEYGVLSTASADGQPYGVPVSYAYADDRVYFHCALEGHKLDNLASNPRVSFCVVGGTEVLPSKFATRYESAIVTGRAFELAGDDKVRALEELVKKYSGGFVEQGERYIKSDFHKVRAFAIEVETLTGKARR